MSSEPRSPNKTWPMSHSSLLDLDAGDILTGNYDMIVSSMTFHHIEKIAPVLNQFHRCLTPGGYLCIADPDPEYGLFHNDSKGVFRYGFERTVQGNAIVEAGFGSVKLPLRRKLLNRPPIEAARFSVFLMTALKWKGLRLRCHRKSAGYDIVESCRCCPAYDNVQSRRLLVDSSFGYRIADFPGQRGR